MIAVLAARVDDARPRGCCTTSLDRCAAVVERHGGTVERHLGDALVGLFGLTEAHGDDALRAARAAVELRATHRRAADRARGRRGVRRRRRARGRGRHRRGDHRRRAVWPSAPRRARSCSATGCAGPSAPRPTSTPASGRLLELRAEQPALLRGPATPFVDRAAERALLRAAFAQAPRRPGLPAS